MWWRSGTKNKRPARVRWQSTSQCALAVNPSRRCRRRRRRLCFPSGRAVQRGVAVRRCGGAAVRRPCLSSWRAWWPVVACLSSQAGRRKEGDGRCWLRCCNARRTSRVDSTRSGMDESEARWTRAGGAARCEGGKTRWKRVRAACCVFAPCLLSRSPSLHDRPPGSQSQDVAGGAGRGEACQMNTMACKFVREPASRQAPSVGRPCVHALLCCAGQASAPLSSSPLWAARRDAKGGRTRAVEGEGGSDPAADRLR